MKKRNAERKDISAWFAWLAELPDEGSFLMIMEADATVEQAAKAAFVMFNLHEEHEGEDPLDYVVVRRSWISEGEMVTIFAPEDGSKKEMRERTTVEDDLLEELTTYYMADVDGEES